MLELGLIVGLIVLYFVFMVFWPEWVGIQGKVAKKIEQDHKKDSESKDPEFFK
jgi:H+/gluconate symporter-like permease